MKDKEMSFYRIGSVLVVTFLILLVYNFEKSLSIYKMVYQNNAKMQKTMEKMQKTDVKMRENDCNIKKC